MMTNDFYTDIAKNISETNFLLDLYKDFGEHFYDVSFWENLAEACRFLGKDTLYKTCLEKLFETKEHIKGFQYIESNDFESFFLYYRFRPTRYLYFEDFFDITKNLQEWEVSYGTGTSILLFADYGGLGDTIFFARYFSILKKYFKKVILYSNKSLFSLFEDSFLSIDMIESFSFERKVDCYTCSTNLPYALSLKNDEILKLSSGYLRANSLKSVIFRQKYCNQNNKFKIGFKWCGNINCLKHRIIPIEAYFKILNIPNVQFYSMQTGDGYEELKKLGAHDIIDLGKDFKDFSDTAAAVDNMDLIISNDTSLAHLAGAMGKPSFVLLSNLKDVYYWKTEGKKALFYNSVSVFTQKIENDWDEVMDRVRAELLNII